MQILIPFLREVAWEVCISTKGSGVADVDGSQDAFWVAMLEYFNNLDCGVGGVGAGSVVKQEERDMTLWDLGSDPGHTHLCILVEAEPLI